VYCRYAAQYYAYLLVKYTFREVVKIPPPTEYNPVNHRQETDMKDLS